MSNENDKNNSYDFKIRLFIEFINTYSKLSKNITKKKRESNNKTKGRL